MTSPVATIVLVRHGESEWIREGRFQGRQDPPLSELGRRQADMVAQRLARRDEHTPLPIPAGPPRAIWHSPLSRAADTARAIAFAQPDGVPLRPTDGLIELAQGEWEGQPHSIVSTRWAAELAAWRHSPMTSHAPGGEALPDAGRRVGRALAEIKADLGRAADGSAQPGSDALAAAAGARHDPVPGYPSTAPSGLPPEPWAVLVAHDGIFRLTLMTLLEMPFERFWSLPFNLCAITVVALHDGVPALRAHNLSEHLAPLTEEARAAAEARGDRRGAL